MQVRIETVPLLIARVATSTFGLPIACVVETLRPPPLAPAESDIFVGVSTIRGIATAVMDGGALVGETSAPTRCVVLRIGDRRASLLVDEVVGVRTIAADALASYPPLPQSAAGNRLTAADPELARVLATARMLPERAA